MAEEPAEEKIEFQKNVIQLLQKLRKIPNSAKEVFLWDLIRLANGGLYMYRRKCVYDNKINYTQDSDFVVRIEADKVKNTLSITHKGLGWTKDDLMNGIGCISEDIVNNYLDSIDKYLMNGDPNPYYSALLTPEFSLGVYSAFMVADSVVITTTTKPRRKGEARENGDAEKPMDQYVWDASASNGFFRLSRVDPKAEDQVMKRGTKVTLYLKDEYLEYLDETKLRELVDKYTFDVCPYPIYVSADDDHEREKKRRRTKDIEEDLESLKKDFEGLREICVQALGSQVDKVVVNDRVFDLPGYLLSDSRTYVINPRSPIMKSLLVDFNKDPDSQEKRKKVMDAFLLHCYAFSAIDGDYESIDDDDDKSTDDDDKSTDHDDDNDDDKSIDDDDDDDDKSTDDDDDDDKSTDDDDDDDKSTDDDDEKEEEEEEEEDEDDDADLAPPVLILPRGDRRP